MTTPSEATQTQAAADTIPTGIRVASTLCWIVAVATLLMGLAVGIPELSNPAGGPLTLILTTFVALAVGWAAMLIRRQRRIGILVLVLAWAAPTISALVQGQTPHGGPLLVVIAVLLAAANWKDLH